MRIENSKLLWSRNLFRKIESPTEFLSFKIARSVVEKLKREVPESRLFNALLEALKVSLRPINETIEVWSKFNRIAIKGNNYILVTLDYIPSSRLSVTASLLSLFCPTSAFIYQSSKSKIRVVTPRGYRMLLKGLVFHRELEEELGSCEVTITYDRLWGRVDVLREVRVGRYNVLAVLELKSSIRRNYYTPYQFLQAQIYGGMVKQSIGTEYDHIVPILVTPLGYKPLRPLSKESLDKLIQYTDRWTRRLSTKRGKTFICRLCEYRDICINLYYNIAF